MKNLLKSTVLLAMTLFLFSQNCFAHSYWLEVKGNGKVNDTATVYLYFGEFEKGLRENKEHFLKNMESFTAYYLDSKGLKQDLILQKDSNCFKASFVPTSNGIYTIMMKENSRAVQDWTKHGLGIIRPFENLKVNYNVGKVKNSQLANFETSKIDIIVKKENCQLILDNKEFANKSISITNDKGKSEKVKTDENGFFTIPNSKGMFIIDVDYKDGIKGEYNSKLFDNSRYKYALTLYVY